MDFILNTSFFFRKKNVIMAFILKIRILCLVNSAKNLQTYVWCGGEFREITVLLLKLQNVVFGKITLTHRNFDNFTINK